MQEDGIIGIDNDVSVERLRRMYQAATATSTPVHEKFIVDGLNVCSWYRHRHTGLDLVSIRPLLALLCEIREHGDDFFCVFDHSIEYHLTNEREVRLVGWLTHKYPNHFYRTASNNQADLVILLNADHHHSRIISNESYSNFYDQFDWLSKKDTPRLVKGDYDELGYLYLYQTSYGYMEINRHTYTQDFVDRLDRCLANGFDWHSVWSKDSKYNSGREESLDQEASTVSHRASVTKPKVRATAPRRTVKTKSAKSKRPKKITKVKSKTKTKLAKTKTPKKKTSRSSKVKTKKTTRKRIAPTRRRSTPAPSK